MKKNVQTNHLLIEALKFVNIAQHDPSNPIKQYCNLVNGFVMSGDGILAAGHPIDIGLEARPDTKKLMSALINCTEALTITQIDNTKITIKSAKFIAHIPCYNKDIDMVYPDKPIIVISNVIKEGLLKIGHITQDNGDTVYASSVKIESGHMTASNGLICFEYWHGIEMPTMNIPKRFISAIANTKKTLVSMGHSPSSVTFWFDDGSWLKSQLFIGDWPETSHLFNHPVAYNPINPELFNAVRSVQDFSEDGKEKGYVYFTKEGVSSHNIEGFGAFVEVLGLSKFQVMIRQLKNIEHCCDHIAFDDYKILFYDHNSRGCLMGLK